MNEYSRVRKILLLVPALVLAAAVKWSFGSCSDTTWAVTGTGTQTLNTTTLNSFISSAACTTAATMTIRIQFGGDTLKTSNEIIVTGRSNKTTVIEGRGPSNAPLVLAETGPDDPMMVDVKANNRAVLSNFSFHRMTTSTAAGANTGASVRIEGKGSRIADCFFYMADNANESTPRPLVQVTADSVLVERSLFRTPPNGNGRAVAIHTQTSANKLEVRSNIFYGTGLFITSGTSIHIYANTFAGSRNKYNAIIAASNVTNTAMTIWHNLFAAKIDNLAPIAFASTAITASDSIIANAWSRSTNVALAVNGSGAALTLRTTPASVVNVALPKGFSDYAPTKTSFRQYPLVQLKSDSLLNPTHADFGKIPNAYAVTPWAPGIPSIPSDLPPTSPKLHFASPASGTNFAPIAGAWAGSPPSTMQVGASALLDVNQVPSPINNPGGFVAIKHPTGSPTTMKVTTLEFDRKYFGEQVFSPSTLLFFFSDSVAKLASNDSTTLKAAVGASGFVRKSMVGFDSILAVPQDVRTGGDIYVKVLHYNDKGQGPVHDNGAITSRVTGIPGFPLNELSVPSVSPSNSPTGNFTVEVTRTGSEPIDSVKVVAAKQAGGATVSSLTQAAPGTGQKATFNFLNLERGNLVFYAVPIKSGRQGSPTANSPPVISKEAPEDIVYFSNKAPGTCPNPDGLTPSNPFCVLDSAIAALAGKTGGTILVLADSPPIEGWAIAPINAGDQLPITIQTNKVSNEEYGPRVILRGTASKAAVTITRKNVTLRGFFIDMPAGAAQPAADIRAGTTLIDGNIFRPTTAAAAAGPAIRINAGSDNVQIINNIIWGYDNGIDFTNSPSAGISILHNTFAAEAFNAAPVGISASAGDVGATAANNFFSGYQTITASNLTGKGLKLQNNVYSTSTPSLAGLQNGGALDSAARLGPMDLLGADYKTNATKGFVAVMENAATCNQFTPCSPIYAGAAAVGSVTTDVSGRARVGKADVGAHEMLTSPGSFVKGRLSVALSGVNDASINFTITPQSYDPAEVDSIVVWWSTTASMQTPGSSPRMSFPVSGAVTGKAEGLRDQTTYYIYAAFFKSGVSANSGYGYAYSDSRRTLPTRLVGACTLKVAASACPAFRSLAPYADDFETTVKFSESIDSGVVANPEFAANATNPALQVFAGIPSFTLAMDVKGLGAPASPLTVTAEIEMGFDPQVQGQDLYILPADANGLPAYVPNWSVQKVDADTWRITVETISRDKQTFVFGLLKESHKVPGTIQAVNPDAPPVFDFNAVSGNNDTLRLTLPVKGSGFRTSNPLVIASFIGAGDTAMNVIHQNYHSRSMVFAAGLPEVDPTLRHRLFHAYYQKALAAESRTPATSILPFRLDAITADLFDEAVAVSTPNWAISPSGELGQVDLSIPLTAAFKALPSTGKASRSVEVVFTIFDGERLSRSSAFIRTRFKNGHMRGAQEKHQVLNGRWNLFAYPWAETDSGGLERVVGDSSRKWNSEEVKLMSYKGSGTGASAFNIYTGGDGSTIKFHSGAAAWSARKDKPYTAFCLGGTSLDYKPFNLALNAGQWNDIGLPFNFPILWKDVLDGSDLPPNQPVWRFSDSGAVGGWEQLTPTSIVRPWQGLAVRPPNAATLKFPVLDADRSPNATPKVAAKAMWMARVRAEGATAAMTVAIGKAPAEQTYSEAPDVPGQDFRIGLKRTLPDGEESLSQFIRSAADGLQGHWALKTTAGKNASGIRLRLVEDSGMPIWLVDALHKTAVPLRADAETRLTAEEMRSNDYHLVAGDDAYLRGVLDGLIPLNAMELANYPNPFSGTTLIRYALPAGFGAAEFRMKVRDARGRVVWEKTQRSGHALSYLWDGRDLRGNPVPSGFYTLAVEAAAPGKAIHKALRRILKM